MKFILLLGRLLYSLIFLLAMKNHFSANAIAYGASKGVPFASLLVPASGIIAFVGAASILLGFHARKGAWLIVIFLVPVTLMMHDFWNVADPMQSQMQMANFMKNISLLGAALMITYLGSGPLSVDSSRKL